MSRFGKRADLIVHEEDPFNAETGLGALAEGPVTATDAFYVRGHGRVPEIDPAAWRLCVDGLVERELELSLPTLREAFREREVVATLQCAGNRRAGLMAIRGIPGEAPWGPGATGTATWTGVALADVLALAAPREEAAHAGFVGADLCPEAVPGERFGGSVPLDKACRPEVLLAWGMNGDPLPAVHGAPVRLVVPGYIGARSVKWVERIEVRSAPWDGYFQRVAYRLLPEDGTPGPGAGMPLGLVALNADVFFRSTARPSPPGGSRCAAMRLRAVSAPSSGSTCRSTPAHIGHRPSCSTISARGHGGTGGSASTWRRENTRSSSAPGTPRRPPSRRARRRCGTRRGTRTTPALGSASAPRRRRVRRRRFRRRDGPLVALAGSLP